MIALITPEEAFAGRAELEPMALDKPVYHVPVLLQECVRHLEPAAGKLFVDATLGGGGHSEAFLEAGATIIGIDQDPEAIEFASAGLARFGSRFRAIRCNFAEAGELLDAIGITLVDGVLMDLGVSSHQLDETRRGFSFMREAKLDMRMNPDGPITAADLVNTMGVTQLARIFKVYGEEPAANRIAQRLVRDRAVRPFETTLQLAEAVEAVVPRRGKTHPATRVFQALRMAVNRELDVLPEALELFAARLAPGGRFGVISFHSLEDRIVKQFFATRSAETVDDPTWPAARPNPQRIFRKITGKAVIAGEAEQQQNPRARSAKLRVVEKL
jgi:16S rRNA (cytosine1402-N4)-methyltransferase